jgi:hypothetical protein
LAGTVRLLDKFQTRQPLTLAVRRTICKKLAEMKPKLSQDYQTFQQYVFGDYKYYHSNGLSEGIFAQLAGVEREKAEKLVLQAIKKHGKDERPIKAAGYLKIQAAAPILEAGLVKASDSSRLQIRISSAWAFFKITGNQKYLNILADVAGNPQAADAVTRSEAMNLLSDFGKEPAVIEVLLHALLDKNLIVSQSAHFALLKVFQDDFLLHGLIKDRNYATTVEGWDRIVREIRMRLLP